MSAIEDRAVAYENAANRLSPHMVAQERSAYTVLAMKPLVGVGPFGRKAADFPDLLTSPRSKIEISPSLVAVICAFVNATPVGRATLSQVSKGLKMLTYPKRGLDDLTMRFTGCLPDVYVTLGTFSCCSRNRCDQLSLKDRVLFEPSFLKKAISDWNENGGYRHTLGAVFKLILDYTGSTKRNVGNQYFVKAAEKAAERKAEAERKMNQNQAKKRALEDADLEFMEKFKNEAYQMLDGFITKVTKKTRTQGQNVQVLAYLRMITTELGQRHIKDNFANSKNPIEEAEEPPKFTSSASLVPHYTHWMTSSSDDSSD